MKRAIDYERVYLMGYRRDDPDVLCKLNFFPGNVREHLRMRAYNVERRRDIVKRSLGFHVEGASLPMPDPYYWPNIVGGVKKRFGCETPSIDFLRLRRFRMYVKRWLRQNLQPISLDADASVEGWLAKCNNYTEERKCELMRTWVSRGRDVDEGDYVCSSFIKREEYPEFKEARLINSRSDIFKCLTGPYFKLIEEEVYKRPEFIKHVPVPDRPRYIMENVGDDGTIIATDHTAFEAHISSELMLACEMQLYRHMLKDLPGSREVLGHMRDALTGLQTCEFSSGVVQVLGARMSGDMCTSLGNGFTNLMAMKFCAFEKGCEVRGVVEGDDGLFNCVGFVPDAEQFAGLGLRIKLEVCEDVSSASFCGLIFDPSVVQNLADPIDRILSAGWTTSDLRFSDPKVMGELSRGKALSLAYELPGCPMVCAMARWLLRCTSGSTPKFAGMHGRHDWWSEQLGIIGNRLRPDIEKVLYGPVDVRNRLLVERLWGISVGAQLRFEHWCDSQSRVRVIPLELIQDFVHRDCLDYYKVNRIVRGPGEKDLNWDQI